MAIHSMPFGAEVAEDGSVRFRLWAPSANAVDLVLADHATPIAMTSSAGGWFEIQSTGARPGSRYKFQIDGSLRVPDPASRFQPQDVHGDSEVIDPRAFRWKNEWKGRPWDEAVIYELHVGTFTSAGLFSGVKDRLNYLVDLGVTAIELMPVSDFPGRRNWGYDGVLPYAPDSSYGRPDDLKALIDAAHSKGLMVLLDVVYNHFGPEGNYLRAYSPQFFTDRHKTPWGDGLNFDGKDSRIVRDFFIHNALFWLTEYQFDGLRLDAVHAIIDDSERDLLIELSDAVRRTIGSGRQIHLVLENEANQATYLRPRLQGRPKHYDAQWDDDIHHTMHVTVTGEADGYYSDYADDPVSRLGRCLTEGFSFQNDISAYHDGKRRGEISRDLPLTCFVAFLQNHDQVGNRAVGERISAIAPNEAVKAMAAIYLLSPLTPMIFMGEEFAASTPFLFFCDFGKDLAKAVTEGRRNEFARFERFKNPDARCSIPDPNSVITFERSILDWASIEDPYYGQWLDYYQKLLRIRRDKIVPLLKTIGKFDSSYEMCEPRLLQAHWKSPGATLHLQANLSESRQTVEVSSGEVLFAAGLKDGWLASWGVVWTMQS